jgi:hypothetical protein
MFRFELSGRKPTDRGVDEFGRIVVNDFNEVFGVCYIDGNRSTTESYFRERLTKITTDETSIAIQVQPLFAWCFWREGDVIYIQEQTLVDEWCGHKSKGLAIKPGPREEVTDEGEQISFWSIAISDVKAFLSETDT